MELRQLRYFAKIAELKSFSAAARLLNMSQSTLSQQVQQLEHELGVTLLARTSRHVELTEIGSQILPVVLTTLADAETCVDVIENTRTLKTGTLRIGCSYSFINLIDDAMLNFMKQYPDVKLEVKESSMDTLLADLSHHELDLVITYAPLYPMENIISTQLFSNQLAVVMRDTHPLAKQKSVSLKNDLTPYRVIVPDISMQARYVTERLIAKLGLKVKVSVSSNSITNVLDLVAASDMVSFLSTSIIMNRKGIVSRPIAEESPIMKACYHTRKDSLIKYAVKEFIRVLNETQFVRQAQQQEKKK